jgi:hypothetical protein
MGVRTALPVPRLSTSARLRICVCNVSVQARKKRTWSCVQCSLTVGLNPSHLRTLDLPSGPAPKASSADTRTSLEGASLRFRPGLRPLALGLPSGEYCGPSAWARNREAVCLPARMCASSPACQYISIIIAGVRVFFAHHELHTERVVRRHVNVSGTNVLHLRRCATLASDLGPKLC